MPADFFASYSLRELRSSADSDFAAAINLYARFMPPDLRTNSNEITYWVDNYNKTYADRLHICAFYVNGHIAGFCELVYLDSVGLVVIDYMVIDDKYRGGLNVFFEFAAHIEAFIRQRYPNHSFTVAEVAPFQSEPAGDDSEVGLLRLLKMRGFGVIDAPYSISKSEVN